MDLKLQNEIKLQKEMFESVNFSHFEDVDWSAFDKRLDKINRRFASLTTDPALAPVDLYFDTLETGAAWNSMVGVYQPGTNGRWFRFAEVGGTQLVVGNVLQSKAVDTQFTNMAVLAQAIATSGQQTVTVTNGSTTVNANDFMLGSLSVYTAGGEAIGNDYVIMGHTPNVTSGNAITVTLDRAIKVAWTTALKVNMRTNPWKYVIQSPATTLTGTPCGVAIFAAKASTVASGATDANPGQYTWVQTHGVGAVLSDGSSILVGSQIAVPSGTAGAAILGAAGLANIGVAMQAAASAHAIGAFITID